MKQKFLKWIVVPVVAIVGFVGFTSFTEESESDAKKYPTESPYICQIWEWRHKPGGGMEYVYVGIGTQDDCPKTKTENTCTPFLCK